MRGDAFTEESDTDANEADIVVNIGWTYALIGLVIVLGVAGALAAGLWFGRSSATAGTAVQTRLTAGETQVLPPRSVQSIQLQAVPLQSRSVTQARPSQPRSRFSAGVGVSIGGTPTMGDPAPDFTLKNLRGEEVSLSDFKGRPVLINFWATWCPPCRFEMPAIQKMYRFFSFGNHPPSRG